LSIQGLIGKQHSEALFAKDFNEDGTAKKEFFISFQERTLIKFIYMMFGRLAFLDGRAGVTYAILQSIYEYFIVLIRES
jgi:hypothetical protein